MKLKASQRRAVDRALNDLRCPFCNRQRVGLVPAAGLMGLCTSCGNDFALDVIFTERAIRGGTRTVAQLSTQH